MSNNVKNLAYAAIIIGLIAIVISGYTILKPSIPYTYEPTTRHITVTMVERIIWSPEITEDGEFSEPIMVGKLNTWRPRNIYVFLGDTIVLTVENQAEHHHSLVLPEFGVDTGELAPYTGEKTVTFVVDKNGVFEYKCGVAYESQTGKCDPDHDYQVGYLQILTID
jgi:plastocyanin